MMIVIVIVIVLVYFKVLQLGYRLGFLEGVGISSVMQ